MQVVLDTRGLQLSVRNACFSISCDNEARIIHPGRISSILVTAPCRISSPALILAAENEIPVVICNNSGQPVVRMWSSRFMNTSLLRRKQYSFTRSLAALQWASGIVHLKVTGQLSNLHYLAMRKPAMASAVQEADEAIRYHLHKVAFSADTVTAGKKQLLFLEAYAAAWYWKLVGTRLPKPFTCESRVKKQPADGFNACINYLYALLRNHTEAAALSVGLDPALGVIHRDGYKMPSLVFDLIEPFRPVIDRMLIEAILAKKIQENIIETDSLTVKLTKEGKRKLISLFSDKLHTKVLYRGKPALLANHIISEAKLLSDIICKYHE